MLINFIFRILDNSVYLKNSWLNQFSIQALLSSTLAVDSFFLMRSAIFFYRFYLFFKLFENRLGFEIKDLSINAPLDSFFFYNE